MIAALEGPQGILAALDDEVRLGDKGSDERFVDGLVKRAPPKTGAPLLQVRAACVPQTTPS